MCVSLFVEEEAFLAKHLRGRCCVHPEQTNQHCWMRFVLQLLLKKWCHDDDAFVSKLKKMEESGSIYYNSVESNVTILNMRDWQKVEKEKRGQLK